MPTRDILHIDDETFFLFSDAAAERLYRKSPRHPLLVLFSDVGVKKLSISQQKIFHIPDMAVDKDFLVEENVSLGQQ